jgi:hypothetical protein
MTGDTAVRRTAAVERLYEVFGLIPRLAAADHRGSGTYAAPRTSRSSTG